jgi:group I intron endonuclease
MAEPYKIYTLHDPDTLDVRYVGFTSKSLEERLRGHIYDSKFEQHHKARWVRSILAANKRPVILHVETATPENWKERERFWINHFRKTGCRLTNSSDGGDGILNASAETREKMRASMLGRVPSAEARKKMSVARLGKPMSKHNREKLLAANTGRPLSEEHKGKIGKAAKIRMMSSQFRHQIGKHHRRPVFESATGLIFESINQAAANFCVNRKTVSYWIKIGKFSYANNQLKEVITS